MLHYLENVAIGLFRAISIQVELTVKPNVLMKVGRKHVQIRSTFETTWAPLSQATRATHRPTHFSKRTGEMCFESRWETRTKILPLSLSILDELLTD